MHLILEILVTTVKCTWLLLVGIVKGLIPWSSYKDVSGDLVLVTGSGSGIGRLMALRFAELGSNLVLWDVNQQGNEETARLVRQKGVRAYAYTVDLSKRDKIYEAARKVKSEAGDVDILINNAGVVTGKLLMDSPDEHIQRTMDVNVSAHFWTLKSFLPAMMAKNKGHVVTIASIAGYFGAKGCIDYCSSKFAAVGLDESLRNELWGIGKDGVKTTVVCPYFINTGMFDGATTRFPSILPILEPEWAVEKILEAIRSDQLVLVLPLTLRLFAWMRTIFPYEMLYVLGDFIGTNWSMDRFRGRERKVQ